jgi:hypothetical protein
MRDALLKALRDQRGRGLRALVPEHLEVETGKGSDALDRRPELDRGRATLVVDPREVRASGAQLSSTRLIPSLIDQNPCAQSRSPMDMMRHGWSVSLFQASQQ